MEIIFKRTSNKVKKPEHLAKNIFLLYSPRKFIIELAGLAKIDTEIIVLLPKKWKGFVTSKFRGEEIYEFINIVDRNIKQIVRRYPWN